MFFKKRFLAFVIAKYLKKTLLLKMILKNKGTNNNKNEYFIYTAKMD